MTGGEVSDLGSLARRAAARWGDRIALAFDETGERLTYADIERRSNLLANGLASLGIGRGDVVALMLPNRPAFPLSWLAITKIGATMVPVNVFYKENDAGYVLSHSGARAIVTESTFVPLIRSVAAQGPGLETIVCVDDVRDGDVVSLRDLIEGADDGPPPGDVGREGLANIQYTSGTTGRPKGCMLSHAFWLDLADKIANEFPGVGTGDILLTAQPFYYIDPQWNFAACLLGGARLVVLDRFHPASFWQKVRDYEVTFFYCLGVMPRLMLMMPPDPLDREHKVRLVCCSAISRAEHEALEARWGVPWHEVFGMTESGADTFVTAEDHDELVGSGSIGRPARNREIRIVGDDDRPLPRGEVGEMVFRGSGLMDGYFKDPEATSRVFRNGWLHTGDLARMDERGRLYYVGRRKDMIRRSGENISAAEVEETIAAHPAVRMVACVPVPDELRGEEVKAYVVLRPGAAPEEAAPPTLASFCEARLAYFKIPRYWTYRDDLPRTASERVRKDVLLGEQGDPRSGAYDRIDDVWR